MNKKIQLTDKEVDYCTIVTIGEDGDDINNFI